MEFIKEYIQEHGYTPSAEEITEVLGISQRQTKNCLRSLILDGRLETDAKHGEDRAIRIPGYKLVELNTNDEATQQYVVALMKMISGMEFKYVKLVYSFCRGFMD